MRGSIATPSPAMIIENSPRAISSTPARRHPRWSTVVLRAAQYPVAIFVTAVSRPSVSAKGRAGTSVAGLISSPKKQKNVAANRSRNGPKRRCDCSAIGPESAIPTRNAPVAEETWKRCAAPATSNTAPKNGKQNNFVRFVAGKFTQTLSVAHRSDKRKGHGHQRNRDRQNNPCQPSS